MNFAVDAAAARPFTVLELLRAASSYFAQQGIETPRLDAELLLAHARGSARLGLYLDFEKPVSAALRARFRELVKQRGARRVPVAYLTGEKEFWSLPLAVSPEVLTPRPDTEVLVEAVLARAGAAARESGKTGALRVLDLGTGSGAIALALASEWPEAQFVASDISKGALEVARRNIRRHGVGARVQLLAGDVFTPFGAERFDWIVSNPPYLKEADATTLKAELAHEPRTALFAGPDGLRLLRRIIERAPGFLSAGGWLGLEHAPEQSDSLAELLARHGFGALQTHCDLQGRARALTARLGAESSA